MKLNKIITSLALLSSIGLMSQAQAAGTLAGTSISNVANLQFAIGGVAQTPKSSNTVSFVVDRKVNLVIIPEQNVASPTPPGANPSLLKYKITNLGNAPQDFALSATAAGLNGVSLFGLTDTFDTEGCAAYADSNNNGVYEIPGADNGSTVVQELAPDEQRSIFVVCRIPMSVINNDVSIVRVTAQTLAGGNGTTVAGAVLTQTTGANTSGIDVVFAEEADLDGPARDGSYTSRHAYIVRSASLAVAKTAAPICDPVNFNVNPKDIPGAYIRYSITVANAIDASDSARLGNITDVLNVANLTFDPNLIAPTASSCGVATPAESTAGASFKITCIGGTRACTTTPIYRTAVVGDDGSDFTSPNITANLGVALPIEAGYTAGELKAGESVKFEFNAVVK